MYIYDIITQTFVEFYYRDLNTPSVMIVKKYHARVKMVGYGTNVH